MGSITDKSPKNRRGCNCCLTSKPEGAPLGPCAGCVAAGCVFHYGNWKRGKGGKDDKGVVRPACPARVRSKRGGNSRALARKMAAGDTK